MHDDLRWAARFAFLEELWQGRPRVVVDRGLEAWLSAGVAPDGEDDPVAALVDRLLPPSGGGPRAFMGTHEAATARELSRTRPATNFVAVDRLPDLLAHRDFSVAVIDLASIDVDADAEATAALHSSATEVAAGRPGLGPTARRVLERLGDAARAGKGVAIVLPAGAGPGAWDDVQAMEFLAERLGGGRLYGLYQPRMTALVDYGTPGEGDGERDEAGREDEDEDEDDAYADGADDDEAYAGADDEDADDEYADDEYGDDESDEDEDDELDDDRETAARLAPDDSDREPDDEVPLSFDNTLGSMTPPIEEWLIVAGVAAPADGLSLLEVRTGSAPSLAPPATVRAQLHEAQRQADLRAIEVQGWIERADELAAENERLRAALSEAEDGLVRAVHAAEPATHPHAPELRPDVELPPELQAQARLEAAAAEIQGLKWRVGQLEDQLQAARARPLDELEAELATLRARLEPMADASAAPPESAGVSATPSAGPSASRVHGGGNGYGWGPAHAAGPTTPAGTHVQAAVRVLDSLVHRLERGGIEAVKLRADLLALKSRLRRLPGSASSPGEPPTGRSGRPPGPAGASGQ